MANNFFAHVYMGSSFGYGFRNMFVDNTIAALDIGISDRFAQFHDWGMTVRAAERGISSPLLGAGVKSGDSLLGKTFGWGIKFAERVEKSMARFITSKTMDTTMRSLLSKGLPTITDPLVRTLGDDVARVLVNTTISSGGDFRAAANLVRNRQVDVWKVLSQWADPETLKALDGMGILPGLENALFNAASIDDGIMAATGIFDDMDNFAAQAMDELPGVDRTSPAIADAIAVGETTTSAATEVSFNAVIQSNTNSMTSSLEAMKGVRQQASQALRTLSPEKQQELIQVIRRYTIDDSAWGELNALATQSSDVYQSNITRIRNSRKELNLIEEWDTLGIGAMRGEPSAVIADLSLPYKGRKREFIRIAQDTFVDIKKDYWKGIREELWRQTDDMFEQVGKIVPLDETQRGLAATQMLEADKYEKAFPFADGLHYWRDPTPRFSVGKAGAGETVFASLDDGITEPAHLLNAINAQDEAGEFLYRSEGASKKIYKDLTDVDSQTAYDVLYTRRYGKSVERVAAEGAEEVAEELITVYQGRPAGYIEEGGESLWWSGDEKYAKDFAGEGGEVISKQVPADEWQQAMQDAADVRAETGGLAELTELEGVFKEGTPQVGDLPTKLPPPVTDRPSLARAFYEQREGVQGLRQSVLEGLEGSRGQTLNLAPTDETEALLKTWEAEADRMLQESRH
jgi:hypothetical protein